LPKQSTTIHDRKENGRVMFHELLPHSSIGETFIPIGINTRNHDKPLMSHVSMLQQTSDNSWTFAHGAMNTPITTIESCDHLPNQI
jgi:hypothetical protein